ncbi:hypothetical protein A3Q56_00915 [Intoshia linei]|uniref:Uncharacterized protein n=1 Tax=Intoshia linei TaxID=1819745 RepID=A0A177BAR0_9BILA|nr:hypothetical protein A3Q56_00915 [Intoshia linei]
MQDIQLESNLKYPLHKASIENDYNRAVNLVNGGVNVDEIDLKNKTPLFEAVAELLLKSGANVNFVGPNNETSLIYVVISGNAKMLSLLLKYNASKTVKNNTNQTPLELAKNEDIVKLLTGNDDDCNLISYIPHNPANSKTEKLMYILKKKSPPILTQNSIIKKEPIILQPSQLKYKNVSGPKPRLLIQYNPKHKTGTDSKLRIISLNKHQTSNLLSKPDVNKFSTYRSESNVKMESESTASAEYLEPRKRRHVGTDKKTTKKLKKTKIKFDIPFDRHQQVMAQVDEIIKNYSGNIKLKLPPRYEQFRSISDNYTTINNFLDRTSDGHVNFEPKVSPTNLPESMHSFYEEQELNRFEMQIEHFFENEAFCKFSEQQIMRLYMSYSRSLENIKHPFSAMYLTKLKKYTLSEGAIDTLATESSIFAEHTLRSCKLTDKVLNAHLKKLNQKLVKNQEKLINRHKLEANALLESQIMEWKWKFGDMCISCVPKINVIDNFIIYPK